MLALSSKYNIEQVDFTDWMSFQPSNITEEISPHPEALRKYLKLQINMEQLKRQNIIQV